jgi:hypothetical protein
VLLVVRAPVETLPEVACVPDQAPLAVQLVVFVEDQVSVLVLPVTTVVGFALIETVGGAMTVTVADCSAVPPGPAQLSVYVPLAVSAPVETVPEVAFVPDHAPLAVQLVVLADDQVRVLVPPVTTVVGFALTETVGAAITLAIADCVAVPPGPVQVRVYVLFAVNGPVDIVPEVAWVPDQAPLAVQLVAFVDVQLRVVALPLDTLAGFTLIVTSGAGVPAVTVTVAD